MKARVTSEEIQRFESSGKRLIEANAKPSGSARMGSVVGIRNRKKNKMATQGRNEKCWCGRGKKYKKCCGRFTLDEMMSKLSAYAAANKQKNKLIERSLKFLKACEIDGGDAFLVLVDPVAKNDIIDWTLVGGREVGNHVREALVTRRILAGCLPMFCLVKDKSAEWGWRGEIDATLVGEECRDEFIAFASLEGQVVAATLRGKMAKEDGWVTAIPWEDLSYPGMPLKPRPAGTIRIEVNIAKRTITIVSVPLRASIEIEFTPDHLTGDEVDDALFEARHVIEALRQVDPPKRLVDGDRVEIWRVVPDGEKRLLLSMTMPVTPWLTRNDFDVHGDEIAN